MTGITVITRRIKGLPKNHLIHVVKVRGSFDRVFTTYPTDKPSEVMLYEGFKDTNGEDFMRPIGFILKKRLKEVLIRRALLRKSPYDEPKSYFDGYNEYGEKIEI